MVSPHADSLKVHATSVTGECPKNKCPWAAVERLFPFEINQSYLQEHKILSCKSIQHSMRKAESVNNSPVSLFQKVGEYKPV